MSRKPKTPKRTDDETEAIERALIPVSPATGLDPEIRQFLSRMMTGYESAHRTIADMAATQSQSTAELHKAVASAIAMQLRAAEEREELISKRHKRELEAQESAQRKATFGKLSSDFHNVAMLALKRFMGIPLTGNDSHGLQDLLASLTPEQQDGMMALLTDAQRQTLIATLSSLAETESKKLEPPKAEAAE